MEKGITVIKASGERVPFSEDKYRSSLHRSGASDKQINVILDEIKPQLYDGISTHEIYRRTYELMQNKKMGSSGGRYRLRQAILDLGPTGFPFERFVAKLMDAQGFKTLLDQIVTGRCISHEIDIIATKGDERLFVECKFHNLLGERCGIKTTLYVKARYDDIIEGVKNNSEFDQCYLITNAKFSSDSIEYAKCVGMHLFGWAYPYKGGLEKIIDDLGLHPITCLSSLPLKILHELIHREIIFCNELAQNETQLRQLGLSKNEIDDILRECFELCKH